MSEQKHVITITIVIERATVEVLPTVQSPFLSEEAEDFIDEEDYAIDAG